MASEFSPVIWTGTRVVAKTSVRNAPRINKPVTPPAIVSACALPPTVAIPSISAIPPAIAELPPIVAKPTLPSLDDEILVPYSTSVQNAFAQIADPLTGLDETVPVPAKDTDTSSTGRSGRGRRSSYRSGRGT